MTYNLWCHVILKLHQWVKLYITTVHHMTQTTWRHQYKISRDENHYSKKTGTELQYESFIIEFQMTRNRQKGEIQIAGFAPTRLIIFLCHADWLAEINKIPDSKCCPIRRWKIEMIRRVGANPTIWISPFCRFRVIWNSMMKDSYCRVISGRDPEDFFMLNQIWVVCDHWFFKLMDFFPKMTLTQYPVLWFFPRIGVNDRIF